MTTIPHLVLIVLDTVRADSAGLHGPQSPMPTLAGVGRTSTLYPQARATSCWTLPSHASLFTGAYLWRHGCHELHRRLDPHTPTLAEQLSAAGYATGAVSANAWVGPDFGFDRGFSQFERGWLLVDRGGDLAGVRRAGRDRGQTDVVEALRRAAQGGFAPAAINAAHHVLTRRRGRFGGHRVARRAVNLARDLARGGRPVFLFVNLLDAHLRYNPPRRHARTELGGQARAARKVPQDPWAHVGGTTVLSAPQLQLLQGLYRAELRNLDDVVGRLLDGLDHVLGLNDTMLVVTSDHGEHLGEHGLLDHQYALSEQLLRVPLLLRPPGGNQGRVVEGTQQLVDIAPTLLTAAQLQPIEAPGYGRPLDATSRDWAFAEYYGPQPTMAAHARRGNAQRFRRFDRSLQALVTSDHHKLVIGSDGSGHLFDLGTDEGERTDLAPTQPQRVEALRARINDACGGGAGGGVGGRAPGGGSAPGLQDDDVVADEVRHALESLGYLQ